MLQVSRVFFANIWLLKWLYLRPYSLIVGNEDIEEFILRYIKDIFARGEEHTVNYLRTFLELNAHSVFHHLTHIEHPTLIISGFLDHHTPAYQSFEMAHRLKHAHHVCLFAATHFALMEFPEEIVSEMTAFIEGTGDYSKQYGRLDDDKFVRLDPQLSMPHQPS